MLPRFSAELGSLNLARPFWFLDAIGLPLPPANAGIRSASHLSAAARRQIAAIKH